MYIMIYGYFNVFWRVILLDKNSHLPILKKSLIE